MWGRRVGLGAEGKGWKHRQEQGMEQPAGTEEWGVRQRSGRGRAEGLDRGGQDSGARCGTEEWGGRGAS